MTEKNMEKLFEEVCAQYNKHEKKNLKKKDLELMWKKIQKTKERNESENDEHDEHDDDTEGCPYVFSKGKYPDGSSKKGKRCGATPKHNSTHCGLHAKYEGKTKKEQKIVPQMRKGSQIVIRKDSSGRFIHAETGFVFLIDDSKTVIGKVKGAKTVKLSPDDIETCKKWKFLYELPEVNETINSPKKTKRFTRKKNDENDEENENENEDNDEDEEEKIPKLKKDGKTKSKTSTKKKSRSSSDDPEDSVEQLAVQRKMMNKVLLGSQKTKNKKGKGVKDTESGRDDGTEDDD